MPTVLRIQNLRLHFYSDEGAEPAHIHVRGPDGECKFWLAPISLARNRGMRPPDIRRAEQLVFEHQQTLLDAFYDFHGR